MKQLGNCIGRGQFGSVYRSLNLGTGQMVAIKRIRLQGMKEDEVRDVMREVELLKRLSHPSIVKYEGMSRDDDYLNIVLESVINFFRRGEHSTEVVWLISLQVRRKWESRTDAQSVWQIQREARGVLCRQDPRGAELSPLARGKRPPPHALRSRLVD